MAARLDVSAVSVVLGVPLYGRGEHLQEALESLLAQTQPGLALVLCDDGPGDGARAIVEAVAGGDPRVTYRRNERRLGLVENWRARSRWPGSSTRRRAISAGPATTTPAIPAGPSAWWTPWSGRRRRCWRTGARTSSTRTGTSCARWTVSTPPAFPTRGSAWPERCARMRAGDMVYGVYRREPMRRAGVIRRLLLPDRLLLTELSVQGEFVYVPRALRYRRITGPRNARPPAREPVPGRRAGVHQAAVVARAHRRLRAGRSPAERQLRKPARRQRLSLVATHARHNFAFAMHSRIGRVIDWLSLRVRGGLRRAASLLRRR